jgi:hypothetical protein
MGNVLWGPAAKMPIEHILELGPELNYNCNEKTLTNKVKADFK